MVYVDHFCGTMKVYVDQFVHIEVFDLVLGVLGVSHKAHCILKYTRTGLTFSTMEELMVCVDQFCGKGEGVCRSTCFYESLWSRAGSIITKSVAF